MTEFSPMTAPADQVISRIMAVWAARTGDGTWPTQAEVGEILGISQRAVSQMNAGQSGMKRSTRKLAEIYLAVPESLEP